MLPEVGCLLSMTYYCIFKIRALTFLTHPGTNNFWKLLSLLLLSLLSFAIIFIIIIIIIIIIINNITIIIELTHSKTMLENTVEIEPQPVALDFTNLSQYSSHSN